MLHNFHYNTYVNSDNIKSQLFTKFTVQKGSIKFIRSRKSRLQTSSNKFMGRTFQAVQPTHERFLSLNQSSEINELPPSRQNLGPFLENKVM